MKNEKEKATSLLRPKNNPVAMVTPDLDIPGSKAKIALTQ